MKEAELTNEFLADPSVLLVLVPVSLPVNCQCPPQDINTPCMSTDTVEEFAEAENTLFETVFVLADFDSPQYQHLYKRDNRIMGPPAVLHCALKQEVSRYKHTHTHTKE